MAYAILAKTTQEAEQLEDMNWATSVLAGYRDEDDDTDVARGVLEVLAIRGCTATIRTGAGAALCSCQIGRA